MKVGSPTGSAGISLAASMASRAATARPSKAAFQACIIILRLRSTGSDLRNLSIVFTGSPAEPDERTAGRVAPFSEALQPWRPLWSASDVVGAQDGEHRPARARS